MDYGKVVSIAFIYWFVHCIGIVLNIYDKSLSFVRIDLLNWRTKAGYVMTACGHFQPTCALFLGYQEDLRSESMHTI